MTPDHFFIYYALIAPNQHDTERPFKSEYVSRDTTSNRNNAEEVFSDRGYQGDRVESNAMDHGSIDRYDGCSDDEDSQRGSRTRLDEKFRNKFGLMFMIQKTLPT